MTRNSKTVTSLIVNISSSSAGSRKSPGYLTISFEDRLF